MSIARKQGKRNRFDYTARGKGIKINSASRADREWAEWNESQKWMTRWGRLTFCSFYSNRIDSKDIRIRAFLPSVDDKKTLFQNIEIRPLQRSNFYTERLSIWSTKNNLFAKKRSEYKLGGDCGTAVLVSCAKTVRNEDRQKRNAKQWSSLSFDARKQSLLHCEFFRIPQHFVVFAHIDLRVDTNKHY